MEKSGDGLKSSLSSGEAGKLLSVLKGDDGVHFVDVIRAVPENSGEIVRVGRVVHLYLVAESPVLREGVDLSFVINYVSIGNVEQVFDLAALIVTELVTNRLFDNHIVCLLRGQNLIYVLRRSHCIHLVSIFTPPQQVDVRVKR